MVGDGTSGENTLGPRTLDVNICMTSQISKKFGRSAFTKFFPLDDVLKFDVEWT
jgi:hypothetical protein